MLILLGSFGTCNDFFEIFTLLQSHKDKFLSALAVAKKFWQRVINFDEAVGQIWRIIRQYCG